MADGYQRVRARKKIKLPTGDTIYIPVLVKVNVTDQNGQETEVSIDNTSANQTRELHVDALHATVPVDRDGNPQSGAALSADTIQVERIDSFIGLDIITQAQESKYLVDNATGNDTPPPRFTTHQKTHIYRYYKTPTSPDDNGIWVDAELIDEISVVDQNGQEHIYFLNNPTNDQTHAGDISGQAGSDDPDISIDPGGEGVIDTPLRTDPFQNIVNFSSTKPSFGIEILGFLNGVPDNVRHPIVVAGPGQTDSGVPVSSSPPDPEFPLGSGAIAISYATSIPFTCSSGGQQRTGSGVHTESGVPPITFTPASPITFSDWQYIPGGSGTVDPVVSGPPLVVDGKPITGFAASLIATYGNLLAPITAAQDYSFMPPGPYIPGTPGNNWITAFAGVVAPGPSVNFPVVITVSPASFTFNGSNYKAVGLSTNGSNALSVYCVPA